MATADNGFIRFSDTLEGCECSPFIVIKSIGDLKFYVKGIVGSVIFVTTISGESLHLDGYQPSDEWFSWNYDLSTILACGDCFRLRIDKDGSSQYSSIIVYDSNIENTILLKYSCEQPAFGIEYSDDKYSQVRIPAILDEANYNKEESIYTDSNGKRRVLFRDIRKKYQLKVDFLPEWVHDNIMLALSHDHVFIDGVEMDIDGDYSIDWENVDDSACDDLVMAECTMLENFIQRNSNC